LASVETTEMPPVLLWWFGGLGLLIGRLGRRCASGPQGRPIDQPP